MIVQIAARSMPVKDVVALEPGARLGEVLERREMHHFVVRREPNALERGKARRLSSY